ncbi:HAMP domain-containing sensor histidine kinase [Streptomyces sp. NPDC047108]|uniref:sensor histidine kinase n=1 Tax=Streptomyces sp. NPDC047108 TaxID=3155025 RepID=UPI0033FDE45B
MSARRSLGARWRRRRPLRTRLALVAAAAVAMVVVGVCAGAFVVIRHELNRQLDLSLSQAVTAVGRTSLDNGPGVVHGECRFLGSACVQIVPADRGDDPGRPYLLPVTQGARDVAAGRRAAGYKDISFQGYRMRVLTQRVTGDRAVQAALRADTVERGVRRAAWLLGGVGGAGVLLAGGLGYWVSRTGLAPVARLTATAERIAATRDARHRIELPPGPPGREDEVTRLASSFNTMLGELEQSVAAQRQLVADASHELRTPLTALRTNAELLARGDRLTAAQRERAAGALGRQLREVGQLVGDLIELARDEEPQPLLEEVRLASLLEYGVGAAREHWPGVAFTLEITPDASGLTVPGVPSRLSRMLGNLLDNAAKFSPPGGPVETALTVEGGAPRLVVRDHGPGVAEADLPYVFDRFYRADAARALPGSGLGLAMVRRIALAHGAEPEAGRAPGGGAVFTIRFPARD